MPILSQSTSALKSLDCAIDCRFGPHSLKPSCWRSETHFDASFGDWPPLQRPIQPIECAAAQARQSVMIFEAEMHALRFQSVGQLAGLRRAGVAVGLLV